jgi:hypothetical protein
MQTSISQQLPEQFSSVMGLGVPVGIFAPSKTSRWGSAIFGMLLLGGSALTVLGGIFYAYDQADKHGSAFFQRAIGTPLIIAAIMFVIGAALAYSAFNNWNKAAVLYEKGLAYQDNKGMQMLRWEEIVYFFFSITKHYRNGVYVGTTYIYTLQKADNSRVLLNNALAKVQDLGNAIEKAVFPIQYQRIVEQLKLGQPVSLGPVLLNKDGIGIGKKSFVWPEVEQVGIQNGYINVKKKNGGWFSGASIPVSSIPNLQAMLAVVDQIVKVKPG